LKDAVKVIKDFMSKMTNNDKVRGVMNLISSVENDTEFKKALGAHRVGGNIGQLKALIAQLDTAILNIQA